MVETIRTGGAAPAPAAQPATAPAPGQPERGAAGGAPAPAAPRDPRLPTAATVDFPEGADEVLVPMTQMRKGIAAQMTRALQAPHAYVQMEVDVTRLVALPARRAKKAYQAKEGISLSYVPFVVKAVGRGAQAQPDVQRAIGPRRACSPSAGSTSAWPSPSTTACSCPVIRDADTLSIHGLNVAITDVANRARANKLRVDDFGGGTFTVDNTGYLGTNLVMPILNVPEVGIVTMEAITKRPVVQSTPGRRRHRHPARHEHGPRRRPPGERRRRRCRAAARHQGLARGGRAGHADLLIAAGAVPPRGPVRLMRVFVTGGAGFIGAGRRPRA